MEDLLDAVGGKLGLLLEHAAVQSRQFLRKVDGEVVKMNLVVRVLDGFPGAFSPMKIISKAKRKEHKRIILYRYPEICSLLANSLEIGQNKDQDEKSIQESTLEKVKKCNLPVLFR
jgi:hypothetical protein